MILDVLSKDDCEQVRLWRNSCLETLRTPYPLTKEMQEDFYRDVVCNRNSPHRYWGIYCKREDVLGPSPPVAADSRSVLIGMGGLTNIEWENSQAEISLIINPALQKQGHGKEAVRLLLDQAFNYLSLALVYGECYACNPATDFWLSVLDAYRGRISRLRKGKFWNGKLYDTMYFDVSRDEFREADNPVLTA